MQTAHLATQEAEHVQESASLQDIRRLTFDDVVLELPVDDEPPANRKVSGVLGREVKDRRTGKPVLPFQQVADQLGYNDRRDSQNFHRILRQSDFDIQAFVTRKVTTHDRLFPLIETAILETPLRFSSVFRSSMADQPSFNPMGVMRSPPHVKRCLPAFSINCTHFTN